jgi:hypothetical protein
MRSSLRELIGIGDISQESEVLVTSIYGGKKGDNSRTLFETGNGSFAKLGYSRNSLTQATASSGNS